MITLKDEQIETIDFNCEPTGTFDNTLGQQLLVAQLRADLPNLPSPDSTDAGDQAKLAQFTQKVDYLRKHAFISTREEATDILRWKPAPKPTTAPVPPVPAAPPVPAIRSQQNVPKSAFQNPKSPSAAAAIAAAPAVPAVRSEKNPKSHLQNPKSPSQPPLNQPLPTKNQPGSDADQKRITSESTRIETGSTPDQNRTTTGSMRNNGDPRSQIDQRPLEEQETIYAAIKTLGIRAAIKKLARSRDDGGLNTEFPYSTLYRFSFRYVIRQAKEKRALAREACMEELSNLNAASTSAEIAQAYVELRITDSIFEPGLSNTALGKAVRDLNRVHAAKHAERRLQLAEKRAADRHEEKIWDDYHKTLKQFK